LQTIVRYDLAVIVVIMNNNGVYGGDRRKSSEISGPFSSDPSPTSFVADARYELMMEAFGGKGYHVSTPAQLQFAIQDAMKAKRPALINVKIDPFAGSESGRLAHKN
jgi:2-hydroxyacyl-CoA lyase 1